MICNYLSLSNKELEAIYMQCIYWLIVADVVPKSLGVRSAEIYLPIIYIGKACESTSSQLTECCSTGLVEVTAEMFTQIKGVAGSILLQRDLALSYFCERYERFH